MVTTSGSWLLNVSADTGSAQGSLVIPAGGAVVTMPGSTCTVTVGASTVGPLPFDIPNQRVVASNTGTVNYTRTGTGPVCPPQPLARQPCPAHCSSRRPRRST
ncbi:hypothetical protein ACETU7_30210 [Rhodococcus sp. 3Y1]